MREFDIYKNRITCGSGAIDFLMLRIGLKELVLEGIEFLVGYATRRLVDCEIGVIGQVELRTDFNVEFI